MVNSMVEEAIASPGVTNIAIAEPGAKCAHLAGVQILSDIGAAAVAPIQASPEKVIH
jgi:hypothetical protein